MNCEQLKKIEPYYNGELSDQENALIKQHLEGCHDCGKYLNELIFHDRVLSGLKSFNPEINNPIEFRGEILGKVKTRKNWSISHGLTKLLDFLIFILVQPATRYSFVTAAMLIFGVFIYQQTIIVQKIGSLEKRMEVNAKAGNVKTSNRKTVEAFFKKRSGLKAEDKEFNELLDDYRLLQLKHKVLIKALKEKFPDTYQDIMKELEEVELLPENINI